MKSRLLALFLVAGSTMFAGVRIGFGIGVGGGYYAPPPPVVRYEVAPAPYYARPGYAWVGGHYYMNGPRYAWQTGYWARPPYARARWIGPRYYSHRFYPGYWRR